MRQKYQLYLEIPIEKVVSNQETALSRNTGWRRLIFVQVRIFSYRRQFFHNIMKPRKLLSEITGRGGLRKQRSEIINTKYFTSHESTSFTTQANNSIDHLSSISLRDCLDELNAHVFEQRPLRPAFVVQIKKFLGQVQRNGRASRENIENHRISKESKCEEKFIVRSPYIVNRSLKKLKTGMAEFDGTEVVRKTLKKKKINFDSNNNGQGQITNSSKQVTPKRDVKILQRAQEIRQYCNSLSQQVTHLRGFFLTQIQDFQKHFNRQMQKIGQIASKTYRNLLICVKKQHFQRESSLTETIKDLEEKVKQAEERQHVLRDYLKQRETQLVACWAAINLNPL